MTTKKKMIITRKGTTKTRKKDGRTQELKEKDHQEGDNQD
jgi:hypothetical protein